MPDLVMIDAVGFFCVVFEKKPPKDTAMKHVVFCSKCRQKFGTIKSWRRGGSVVGTSGLGPEG